MYKILISIIFISLIFFYACPQTDNYEYEETAVEEKKYDFEVYEEDEFVEEEEVREDDPIHLENPADIAGSLIF